MSAVSPFLDPGPRTTQNTLVLAHLSRDSIQPIYLKDTSGTADGYVEGPVLNTRFGSFPHSTLLDKPWGSQIRASVVDTGSRGRKLKLQREGEELDNSVEDVVSSTAAAKDVKTAPSGFIHILPPTPELWTTSLPHRTQVVYTPDYSYILHRIRARPGMKIIEAGAGSGSFTHASARAVYNGYPKDAHDIKGKVFSFEFNHDRYQKMQKEIEDHRLDGIVQITHRDVYNDGFLVDGESPGAECVFLDLPAPWKALPHLARSRPTPSQLSSSGLDSLEDTGSEWKSPLRPDRTAYLCTFSPCIEQVTRTIDVMRRLGWMEIEMVEVAHRRINVMRERIGLNLPAGDRGASQTAANVAEALAKLQEVEGRVKTFRGQSRDEDVEMGEDDVATADGNPIDGSKTSILGNESESVQSHKPWMTGRVIHRTEPEIKTHTSYLVFALLPQEWTEAQEAAAFENWPCGKESKVIGKLDKEARKQEKRELLQGKKRKKDTDSRSEAERPLPKKSKTP
ncbi:tRNA methyltransferase complex GCD14 subunit [Daldinia vernicosa]|uniref:tRNA methyltransferase complex GCD14 subunit n=1 Tax=Daldinia vernicosa TaxID=114800 RepID=UPI002008BECC|nr:tRNA methyltransferase complex GCD14 subunit [Daldinia vernicosa]KAI0852344.1 tRNA methyltransferase complex GCD14 subunit [Daldinia vernicosa]